MQCTIRDDRTEEQKKTHTWAVVCRDKFMSGWGGATGGTSRCAWACHPDVEISYLLDWVRSRKEMVYVNVVEINRYRVPRGTAHFHIYVCDPNHPAINNEPHKLKERHHAND